MVKKTVILILAVFILAIGIILILLGIFYFQMKPIQSIPQNQTCTQDSDCVGAQCCHPDYCINKNYKNACNLLCTNICQGPLDCNAGHCGCVKGRCSVVRV
jgi:hypothetical protein